MTPLPSPPLDPSREEARRLLEDELAQPRYDLDEDLWDRVTTWFLDLFDRSGPGLPAWVLPIVVIIALAVVALVVVWLLRPEVLARPTGRDRAVLDGRGVDAAAYRLRAQRAQREGDWETALLDAFRTIVAAAVERTVLDDLPGRTAHEASVALGRAFPPESGALRSAADRFDAVRYGHVVTTEADARAMLELDARLGDARPVHAPAGVSA